ncbi:hypothetical protein CL618_00415, partial [archaeon]|nr:hypothetical protein [archaeon]
IALIGQFENGSIDKGKLIGKILPELHNELQKITKDNIIKSGISTISPIQDKKGIVVSLNEIIQYLQSKQGIIEDEQGTTVYTDIVCSRQFREKFNNNKFKTKKARQKFQKIIIQIHEQRKDLRQTKSFGEFFITPAGRKRERVAWFMKGNTIHICEQFFHENKPSGDYETFSEQLRTNIKHQTDYSGWEPIRIELDY